MRHFHILMLLVLGACGFVSTAENCEPLLVEIQAQLEKTQPIRRKHFYLPNGLEVLLIHHPKQSQSYALVRVGSGFLQHPEDKKGIFHLLEHMSFLGTRQHPGANTFNNFFFGVRGQHNGITRWESTNYPILVPHEHFPKALSIFSSMFKNPLFVAESLKSELAIVHDEYKKNLLIDHWNWMYVYQQEICKGHALEHSFHGNNETLGCVTAQDLRKTFKQHYVARNMQLILQGPQSLEQLEQLAKKHFSAVADRPVKQKEIPALPPNATSRIPLIEVKSISDRMLTLVLRHPLASPLDEEMDTNNLIVSALEYEGPGSLAQLLYTRRLAYWIRATSLPTSFSNFIYIRIGLVDQNRSTDTIQHVTNYLKFLSDGGMTEEYVRNQQMIKSRELIEQSKAFDFSKFTSEAIDKAHFNGLSYLLERMHVPVAAAAASVQGKLARLLDPSYWTIVKLHPSFEGNKVERHTQTRYRTAELSADDLFKDLHIKFKKLGSNPYFVAESAPVKVPTYEKPKIIQQNETHTIYWQPDGQFRTGKVFLEWQIKQPQLSTVQDWARVELARELLKMILRPIQRDMPTNLMSLISDITHKDLSIALFANRDELPKLISAIGKHLQKSHLTAWQFQACKNLVLSQWKSLPTQSGFDQLGEVETAREIYKVPIADLIAEIELIDWPAAINALHLLLRSGRLQTFAYGEISEDEAIAWSSQLADTLKLSSMIVPEEIGPVEKTPPGQLNLRTFESNGNRNYLVINAHFDSFQDIKTYSAAQLFTGYLESQFYNDLRTEKQIGYNVYASFYIQYHEKMLFRFYVGSEQDPQTVLHETEDWILNQAIPKFLALPDGQFELLRQAQIATLNSSSENLLEKATQQNYWRMRGWSPERRQERLHWAKTLSKKDVAELVGPYLSKDQRRWTTYQFIGEKK